MKFRVCYAADGTSIGPPLEEVVSGFYYLGPSQTQPADATDTPFADSTTPDQTFRWSSQDEQWIFNASTVGLAEGQTHWFWIALADGSSLYFKIVVR